MINNIIKMIEKYWMNFYFWSRKKSKESIKSALNSMKNRDILDYKVEELEDKVEDKLNGRNKK